MDIIKEHIVKLKYYGSIFYEDKEAPEIRLKSTKRREKLELGLFTGVTYLLLVILLIMAVEILFEKVSFKYAETVKYSLILVIMAVIGMIVKKTIYSELRNYLVSYPIRVRFLPPDLLTITSSYDESDKLILYIRNLGEHKISPKVRIVFPNEVSFKFKGVEFKKNEFTEEDYLKITGKKLEIEPDHEKRLVFHPVYEGRSVRDYGVTTIIVETEGLIIGKDLKTRLLGQSTKTQRQKE